MPVGDEGARRDARASVHPRPRPRLASLDRKVRAGAGDAHRCASNGSYASSPRRCTDESAQLLQTHAHAMQSIQDQQNTLIGAVLPLVPIIHGIPPQVDQIKTAVSDMVGNAVSTMTNSVESVRSTLVSEFAHGRGYTWSSTRLGRSSKSSQRERSDASVFGPQEVNVPVSSPLDSHGHRGAPLALKRARIDRVTHHAGDAQLPRKLSRLAVPLSDPPPLLQTPRTPRQPLADLLFIPGNNISRNSTSRESMRSLDTVRASGGSRNNTPRTRRPFHPPKQGPTITRRHSAGIHDIRLPTVPGPSDRDAISKEIKIEEILEPNFTGIISINSSPMSSPPSSTPLGTRETKNVPCISRQEDNPRVELVQAPPPSSSNPDASPPKSMSLRDRRAQMSKVSR